MDKTTTIMLLTPHFRLRQLMQAGLIAWLSVSQHAWSAPEANNQSIATQVFQKQNLQVIKDKVAAYLNVQATGLPGQVNIQVGGIDPQLKLSACADVNIFMPTGSRPWGKTTVGVSCADPSAWTIYVQAKVQVIAQYLVAATPLMQGQTVTNADIAFAQGDLTQLPAGVFTDVTQTVGRIVNISMNAGTVLRQDMLKQSPVVQQGQSVMVVSSGQGFTVSAEGLAMNKANDGQIVQVKVANGQTVTGIARQGGKVEVIY